MLALLELLRGLLFYLLLQAGVDLGIEALGHGGAAEWALSLELHELAQANKAEGVLAGQSYRLHHRCEAKRVIRYEDNDELIEDLYYFNKREDTLPTISIKLNIIATQKPYLISKTKY